MVAKNVLIFPYEQSDSYMERSAPADKPGPKKDKLESGLIVLQRWQRLGSYDYFWCGEEVRNPYQMPGCHQFEYSCKN